MADAFSPPSAATPIAILIFRAVPLGKLGGRADGGVDWIARGLGIRRGRATQARNGYTAHSDHSASEPPTYVVVGSDDGIAPPCSMESRIAELQRLDTPVEYRKFASVGHGFGRGTGTTAESWIIEAPRFWERSR